MLHHHTAVSQVIGDEGPSAGPPPQAVSLCVAHIRPLEEVDMRPLGRAGSVVQESRREAVLEC
jgi:hypothetical protein